MRLRRFLAVAVVLVVARCADAQVPGTDVYRIAVDGGVPAGAVENLTARPGYDNQPAFLADGSALRYTVIDSTGRADVWELAGGVRRRLTGPPTSEYSPLPIPGLDRFSVIRVEADSTQRVWSFAPDGTDARLVLADRPGVGYHAWLGPDELLLFVLGDPHELHRARVGAAGSVRVATDVGRCLQTIPGARAWSFPRADSETGWTICRLDADTGTLTPITPAPTPAMQDHCWTPEGRLWSSDGTRILEFEPGDPGQWRELADLEPEGVREISRMTRSADALVFVAVDAPAHPR